LSKKKTTNEFIKEAIQIHGNEYDYSLVNYKGIKNNVDIICNEHGIFSQRAQNHLNGLVCPKCKMKKYRKTTDEFIKEAIQIHDNKYDYSLVKYENIEKEVNIICPTHGEFQQKPWNHLKGFGCKLCSNSYKYDTKTFIEKSKKIHGNKYDYSLVDYTTGKNKVIIICSIHGKFEQRADRHLLGFGCRKCGNIAKRKKFIEKLNIRYNNGHQISPNFNPVGCEVLDNISNKKNIHIQHAMNGGEFYIKELGYWVDGYDKENNIVYEFDEKYHFFKLLNM
jgi:hypothetical protein